MKNKKKIHMNKTKKRCKYEVEDILELIGLINNSKNKKEGNNYKKKLILTNMHLHNKS